MVVQSVEWLLPTIYNEEAQKVLLPKRVKYMVIDMIIAPLSLLIHTPPLLSFALFMVNSIKNRMTILCMDAVFVVVEQKWITNHLLKPQSILMVSDTTTRR